MQNAPLAALALPVVQFLLRFDAKSSYGCLASLCGRFLVNSYLDLMQNPSMATLPPPVVVSYSIFPVA